MRVAIYTLLAAVLAVLHMLVANMFVFFGSVINPEISHQILNLVGFVLMMPFGLIMLVPMTKTLQLITGILIFIFWTYMYYNGLRKAEECCPRIIENISLKLTNKV